MMLMRRVPIVRMGRRFGQIYDAASAARADVQSAVDAASAGDLVRVPAGASTWDGAVAVSKPIQIT